MPGLDAARLRALADELEQEEANAHREAENAATAAEREAAAERERALEARIADLEQRLEGAGASSSSSSDDDDQAADDDDQAADEKPKRKTRPGRKHGAVYQDDDGVGYVYQGADEPAVVVLDEPEGGDE